MPACEVCGVHAVRLRLGRCPPCRADWLATLRPRPPAPPQRPLTPAGAGDRDLAAIPGHIDPAAVWEALDELMARPAWHADAACRDHPELDWFPTAGADSTTQRAICASCPVRAECLDESLRLTGYGTPVVGIWAGLGTRARKALQRDAG